MWREQKDEIIEFQHKLKREFPRLFEHVKPYICKGWHQLIYDLTKKISEFTNNMPNPPKIFQVKEKFGGLEFHMEYVNESISELIRNAENNSYKICEWCGKQGANSIHNSWIKTLCMECHNKRVGIK